MDTLARLFTICSEFYQFFNKAASCRSKSLFWVLFKSNVLLCWLFLLSKTYSL